MNFLLAIGNWINIIAFRSEGKGIENNAPKLPETTEQEKKNIMDAIGMNEMVSMLAKAGLALVDIRNIDTSGEQGGCDGFVMIDGKLLYFSTEPSEGLVANLVGKGKVRFHAARNTGDLSGVVDHWVDPCDLISSMFYFLATKNDPMGPGGWSRNEFLDY